jgi:hypothetical protein
MTRVLERFQHAEDLIKTEKESRWDRIVVLTHGRIFADGCDTDRWALSASRLFSQAASIEPMVATVMTPST